MYRIGATGLTAHIISRTILSEKIMLDGVKKMENIISFTLKGIGNWTAVSLLKRIAEQNNFHVVYGKYGEARLLIHGKLYSYSRVNSIKSEPITVYLKKEKK